MDPKATPATPARSSNELAAERTDLALVRTGLAQERTLMAWVRTATSLIGFGFTIYKIFQGLDDTSPDRPRLFGPRELGLSLTALGTVALALAMWQHRQALEELRALGAHPRRSVALIVAAFIVLIGLLVFFAVLIRI
jgi:putative membrane protein